MLVVVDPQRLGDPKRTVEIDELVLVEAIVAKAAVEALHEAILRRLAQQYNVIRFRTDLPSQNSVL